MEDLKAGVSIFCKRNDRDSIWFLHCLEIFLYFSVSVRCYGQGWSGQSGEEKMLRKMKEIYFLNTVQTDECLYLRILLQLSSGMYCSYKNQADK